MIIDICESVWEYKGKKSYKIFYVEYYFQPQEEIRSMCFQKPSGSSSVPHPRVTRAFPLKDKLNFVLTLYFNVNCVMGRRFSCLVKAIKVLFSYISALFFFLSIW